jgi:hypothetical protein
VPLVSKLPRELENGKALLKRRESAAARKELWRDIYRDAYDFTMPQRENFSWHAPGQKKSRHLYDSTGQQSTYLAANNIQSLLCPPWKHWAALAPGGLIPEDMQDDPEITNGLQEATKTVFHYINHSNFSTVIPEVMLDLMVGTAALSIDEGDADDPLLFDAIPLATIELEEGPRGTIETTFMKRAPVVRNLVRMYPGMRQTDLPSALQKQIKDKPESTVEIVQGCVYDPKSKRYFGVVIECETAQILWRYDYEDSSPHVVGRASVTAGEIYGRGRVLMALPDIKTLNVMQEYLLEHSALQVAPPLTGVSDGVLNPYTTRLIPNSVIPVASNANNNPSLMPLEIGGNFLISQEIMEGLRASVRQILLGSPRAAPNDQPPRFAMQLALEDRDRLWDMGAEYGRIQAELLSKIVARVVWILQRQGKIPPIKINGEQVTLKYVSPLARAQDQDDLLSLSHTLELSQAAANLAGDAGAAMMAAGFKIEEFPAWLSKRTGLDASLIRTEAERTQLAKAAQRTMQQQDAA